MTASPRDGAKRVLMIVENLPVPFDRRVWMEATTLKDAGYDVSIISPMDGAHMTPFETIDGIDIHRHPLRQDAKGFLGYVMEYASAVYHETRLSWKVRRGRGFDIIHACNPPDLIFLVALPHVLTGKIFIFDHHDLCPELFETKFERRGAQYWMLRVFERLTFGLARISIATNESYREIAIGRGSMPPERVFVVRSGPNVGKIKPGPTDPALRKGRRYMIGYVGVVGKQEGLDLLIEAAAWMIANGYGDVEFGIVGSGPELETVKAYAIEQGVADHFTFYGRAPDEVLMRVLNTADVCVNPDRVDAMNNLSTMNKIMEYMALGKPIVQFDVKEGRVSAQEASLYAAANDAVDFARRIVELLDAPERRERMGGLGRERVSRSLSWDQEAPKLLAAYKAAFAD